MQIELNAPWKLTCLAPDAAPFTIDARVPGCAIADLVRDGRLPSDLFYRKNADATQAYEACDYVYETVCTLPRAGEATLSFERIDTYADVYVNGRHVYHSENGNIRHDIPLEKDVLQEGNNTVTVKLFSPVTWVKDRPARSGAFTTERLHTRRMQCTYGWDWVARFVTCGLGACTLTLAEEDEVAIDGVYITTRGVDADSAEVRVDVTFLAGYRGRIFTLRILSPDGAVAAQARRYYAEELMRTELTVPRPKLWYPRGYGDQPLYTFVLLDGERVVYSERFGIRTVRIEELPDAPDGVEADACVVFRNPGYDHNEQSRTFRLKINGTPIVCLGANWVPCTPYVDGDIRERQTAILERCAEAGVNMLRVWGGGAFESRHFYDECSRLGITVTQDFLMACGAYPEDEAWFLDELAKEAKYAARLIRNQPCLVWWSGDNENAVDGCDTDEDYKGRRSAYRGIAPVLYREDPERRLLASSPYGGSTYASNTVGTTHNTQYLGDYIFPYMEREDVRDYKDAIKRIQARFIAEEPQFGAASYATLRRFMTEEDILQGDDMWIYHTKGNPGLCKELYTYAVDFAEHLFGTFVDGRDRLAKFRYLQYEWVRLSMEQVRRHPELSSGIIFWMMNDCWPAAAGWALIDYYNRPKDAWYAFRRCAAPCIGSIDREGGTVSVYLSNKARIDAHVSGTLMHLAADHRTVLHTWPIEADVPGGASPIALSIADPLGEGELLILDTQADGRWDRTFYALGAPTLVRTDVHMDIDEQAQTVTVTADGYVHAVLLDGDAVFDDNAFSLLAGESRTVAYRVTDGAGVPLSAEGYTLA